MSTTSQRCRVHVMRNALAYAGRSGQRLYSAFIASAFAHEDAEAGRQRRRRVADQLRPEVPKLAAPTDGAETDVLADMTFPVAHRIKLRSANRILRQAQDESVNGEVNRRPRSSASSTSPCAIASSGTLGPSPAAARYSRFEPG